MRLNIPGVIRIEVYKNSACVSLHHDIFNSPSCYICFIIKVYFYDMDSCEKKSGNTNFLKDLKLSIQSVST
jgi:hypothetical protein